MKDSVKEFHEQIEKARIEDEKKKALAENKLVVDSYKVQVELDKIIKNEADLAKIKSSNVGPMSQEEIDATVRDNERYLNGAKEGMMFINETFKSLIPLFPGQFVVVGGKSGEGKSTAAANIAYSIIKQKNKKGENKKALIITNEETKEAFFNRLTCIGTRLNYANHHNFTDAQRKMLIDAIPVWARRGVTIISDDENKRTTSIEGIEAIFENLIRENIVYDAIILDYSQKVSTSKKNMYMKLFEVQSALAYLLDKYKNIYPGAIIVMTQVMSNDSESPKDFQDRLRGSKDLFFPATVVLESIPDRENLRTKWVFHKHRYMGDLVGKSFETGYDAGKFVMYTDEFKAQVAKMKELAEESALNKQIGISLQKEEKNE